MRKIDFDAENEVLKVNNVQMKLPRETFIIIRTYFDIYYNENIANKIYYDSKIFAKADNSTFQIDFEKEIEISHLRVFEDFVMLLIEDTFNPFLIMRYTGLDAKNLELIASKLGYILSDDKKNFVNIENRPIEIKRNELIHPLKSLEDEDGIIHYYLRKVA